MGQLTVNLSYPYNEEFDYESEMIRLNLDEERENDLRTNKGFIISEHQSIKKDIKAPNGIFSTKYGQTLQDMNPYADRHKCECGYLSGRVYKGTRCKICNTMVKYIDDDFSYFGWIILKDPYYIIHPNIFKALEFFIGSIKLDNMLNIEDSKNQDGYSTKKEPTKEEPFKGIGMIDFKIRFEEIMNFYLSKNPDKRDYYTDIMDNKDNIFTQSIPVYTTHLRPFKIDVENFFYEGTNAIYNMMVKLVSSINKDNLRILRKKKPKNQLLYDLQVKYSELYKEMENTLSSKKGSIRGLFGGRLN